MISGRRRYPAFSVPGVFMCLLLLVPKMGVGQEIKVDNVQAYQKGTQVIVEYDLMGTRRATYEVDLLLSRNGGDTFDYAPTAISGAVGERLSAGRGKEIVWSVLEDFPDGLEGDNYKFKVIARRGDSVPSTQPPPTAEGASTDDDEEERGLTVRLGVGLAYNTRQDVDLQYYDGYQVSLMLQPTGKSISLKASYRSTTGQFKQQGTLDFDLLYNGGFYYLGTSAGIYNFSGNVLEVDSNRYNLSAVAGVGFSIGSIYPYVEYRYPFSRGRRDDVLGGGLLFSF